MTKPGGAGKVEQPAEAPSAEPKVRVSLDEMRTAAAAARASTVAPPASGEVAPKPGAGDAGGEGKPAGEGGAAPVVPETPPATPPAAAAPEGGEDGVDPEGRDPAEPVSHEERTRLGRNIAELRRQVTESNTRLTSALETVTNLVEKLAAGGAPAAPAGDGTGGPAGSDDGDDTPILTAGDVKKVLKADRDAQTAEAAKVVDARRKYGQVFVAQFGAEEYKSDPMLVKVQAVIMGSIRDGKKDFNQMYTGNPTVDFKLNFLEAKNYLLAGGTAPSTPAPPARPTKGEKPIAPTGVGGDSRATGGPAGATPIAVDPVGLRFLEHVASLGKNPDDLTKRAFAGELRADLRPGAARVGAKTA